MPLSCDLKPERKQAQDKWVLEGDNQDNVTKKILAILSSRDLGYFGHLGEKVMGKEKTRYNIFVVVTTK